MSSKHSMYDTLPSLDSWYSPVLHHKEPPFCQAAYQKRFVSFSSDPPTIHNMQGAKQTKNTGQLAHKYKSLGRKLKRSLLCGV
ncbi:hypothetical protein CLU79DRAFT_77842 [Phycomyces nitens]|nr:hypothetical protein CLU79DRAFT_77842 [Phycomyces nitens]